jgi:Mg-chelatase subunit ChlD
VLPRVHISIVLDQSGSMDAYRGEAIETVNAYFAKLRANIAIQARLSLTVFNAKAITTLRDREDIASCPNLSWNEYKPQSGTPLLDAISQAVGGLDCLSHKNERQILAIVTDGLDNASQTTTRSQLFDTLQAKQRDDGWLVLYFGANHNSANQATQIGIPTSHAASFCLNSLSETANVFAAASTRYLQAEEGPPARAASRLTPRERLMLQIPTRHTVTAGLREAPTGRFDASTTVETLKTGTGQPPLSRVYPR